MAELKSIMLIKTDDPALLEAASRIMEEKGLSTGDLVILLSTFESVKSEHDYTNRVQPPEETLPSTLYLSDDNGAIREVRISQHPFER